MNKIGNYSYCGKVLLLVALLCCVCTGAFADRFSAVNNGVTIYYFPINNNTAAEVTCMDYSASNSYSGDVIIPESVTYGSTTLPVTRIGASAFKNCPGLTSVSLPSSITKIGNQAFTYCTGLKSIIIPNSVTEIADYAFNGCSSLTSVTIGSSVESIGGSAFEGCSGLTSITIPNSVTSIDSNAFMSCSGLTSVTLPNALTNINSNVFRSCTSLTSIIIPDKVRIINSNAFYNCTGLTSVTIGKSVSFIYSDAFYGCSSLTKVIAEDITAWFSISFDANPLEYAHHLYSDEDTEIIDLEIPNSIKTIKSYAFKGCTGLTSVTIPSSVANIYTEAFNGCSNLKEVKLLGNTLPKCGTNVFTNISSDATLYCMGALIEDCKKTDPWQNFTNFVEMSHLIEISTNRIATCCYGGDLDFSGITDVQAYIASGFNPKTGKVLMTRVTEVPKGTGFIVKGTEGTYDIPVSETNYVYSNMLVGTLEDISLPQTKDDKTNYVLSTNTEGTVGFYLPDANYTLSAYKAYLQIPTSAVTSSGAKTSLGLSFDDEDDTTGISAIKDVNDGSNGNTTIYNLNGQRKQSLTKGLNIVNGKKIFIK